MSARRRNPTRSCWPAAIALGGGEENLQPALDLFAKLAEQKRLLTIGANPGNMEKGEIEVGIVWDFNALNYRNLVGKDKFDVFIPSEGSVISGYTTTINAYSQAAQHRQDGARTYLHGRRARSISPAASPGRS